MFGWIKKIINVKALVGVSILVSSSFASVDCISAPDINLCQYWPVNTKKYPVIWVVPSGQAVTKANAIKDADFFVYAPKAKDSLILNECQYVLGSTGKDSSLVCGTDRMTSPDSVNSGADGLVYMRAYSYFPVYNAEVGTLTSVGADPVIARIYNFYLPQLEFSDSAGNVIDAHTLLNAEVNETIRINVRAVVPVGPDSGATDTLINKTFYFFTILGSEGLQFYTLGGDTTSRLDVIGGTGAFLIKATRAVQNGSFILNGYPGTLSVAGDTTYMVQAEFPGDLVFENPDMPTLDSASIFDTNGDGVGDSIAAWFSGNTAAATLDSFFYSWPNGDAFTEFDGTFTYKNGVLGLSDVETSLPKDSGQGELNVYATSLSGSVGVLNSELEDKIGPVIRAITIIPGLDGDEDTLVVNFNKDLDSLFSAGKAFVLPNGDKIYVTAIKKNGDTWTFVADSGAVSVGDSLSITLDGGIIAADGNEPSYNRPVKVNSSGRVYLSNENNGFYDSDGDGRMDSVSVGFEMAITQEQLEGLDLRFYWQDSLGNPLEIKPDVDDLVLSSNGKIVTYALSEKWESRVKEGLTSIDNEYYGFAALMSTAVVNDSTVKTISYLEMNDRMAPVISGIFLEPESRWESSPDKLTIEFSEAVDVKAITSADGYLSFFVDGKWVSYDLSNAVWSDNNTKLQVLVAQDEDLLDRANPRDSIRLAAISGGIQDMHGNEVSENSPVVMIEGDPRVLVETSSFIGLDRVALAPEGASFTQRIFPEGTSVKEEMGKSLGVMLDISYATIFDDSTGANLDLSKIGMEWEMYVYTNLGAYVASSHSSIKCDDSDFGGNCFDNPKRIYLRWNLRSDDERKVGVGVYVAKFYLKVYGEKESYTYERIFKWGVHGGKNGLALD